jgi:MtN3 and saliva related transmembrane protein
MDFVTVLSAVAALCTTVSYFPQLKKCWQSGHTRLVARYVSGGAIYGFLKADPVIICANAMSLALLMGILYFKMREVMSKR